MINISNHPSTSWSEEQKEAALKLGSNTIIDIPFPNVPPTATTEEVTTMVKNLYKEVRNKCPKGDAIHIMGEMTFVVAFVSLAEGGKGYADAFTCYASTTERISEEKDGVKTSIFKFVQFREYPFAFAQGLIG